MTEPGRIVQRPQNAALQLPSQLHPLLAQVYRARGIGSALMQECEARIGDRGAVSVALEVEEGDEVLSFYQKLGYAVTKRDGAARKLEGDIFFGRSVACPRLRLEKILDT